MTTLALNAATTKGAWIVDSGATTHMCNDELSFTKLKQLQTPQVVTLGDGRSLSKAYSDAGDAVAGWTHKEVHVVLEPDRTC